ncbi:CinA family protein [Angustibacter speluncae]
MDDSEARTATVERIADVAGRCSWTVGCAESLTSGAIASALGAGPQAAEWFRGGVVAYAVGVKHDLLDVPEVPVVSREAALAMAQGARARLGADVAVAVTGVGGPEPQDGLEPGTVWVGVAWPEGEHAERHVLDGSPEEVVGRTTQRALEVLASAVERGA